MKYWNPELETSSLAEQRDYRLVRLQDQVRVVAESSPYYRAVLGAPPPKLSSFEEFYEAVPPVTKSQLIAEAAESPPFGRMLCVSQDALVRLYAHPGPQFFAWTRDEQDALVDMYAHGIVTAGFEASDIVDVTFQYGWAMAGTIWDAGVQRIGAAALPGGAGGTVAHIDNLRTLNVSGLMGFPTYVEEIATQARERGIDPRTDLTVRKILVIGELRGASAKERLRSMYAAEFVREAYGTSEVGLVAAECPAEKGMHLHPDVVAEVRDQDSSELVTDGAPGELYLTPLRRSAMPVLRYRTGDITEYYQEDPCACGRITPRIGRILGRASDLIRVKGVFLAPTAVDSVIHEVAQGVQQYQLVVSRPNIRDQLVLRVDNGGVSDQSLASALVTRFKERCRVTVEVEYVEPSELANVTPGIVDNRP